MDDEQEAPRDSRITKWSFVSIGKPLLESKQTKEFNPALSHALERITVARESTENEPPANDDESDA